VKCESYFADNGGRRDLSGQLLQWVTKVYQQVIEAVPNEAREVRGIRTVYAPVDTIGCVEIVRAEWPANPDEPGTLSFHAHYGVRPPGVQSIKGTEDVMVALCRQLVGARYLVEQREAAQAQGKAAAARSFAERDEGFFRNIWYLINGERGLRQAAAHGRAEEAVQAAERVRALSAIVNDLAHRSHSERVHQW